MYVLLIEKAPHSSRQLRIAPGSSREGHTACDEEVGDEVAVEDADTLTAQAASQDMD